MKSSISNNQNISAFLALVRAGLWEKDVLLKPFGEVNYVEIMRLAEEQSVVGLVTAGLEHVKDVAVSQVELLQFIGQTLQIEEQNKAMNGFIPKLTKELQTHGVIFLLVKGQGVARCYEKPLWRASGDVDLLLDEDNYESAKEALFPIADHVDNEEAVAKHQALNIKGFEVELHGRMPFFLSRKVDDVIDEVLADSLKKDGTRIWKLGDTDVFLPKPDNDVIIVFTHFLFHFFVEGVGLRQICDWCRLLWTYKDSLNYELLESRIRKAGLMSEWKAFSSLAVNTLGMPEDTMPFYDVRYTAKAEKVLKRVLKSGNMGHNNDLNYRSRYTGVKYKVVAMWRRFKDFASLIPVFPVDAPKFFMGYLFGKVG